MVNSVIVTTTSWKYMYQSQIYLICIGIGISAVLYAGDPYRTMEKSVALYSMIQQGELGSARLLLERGAPSYVRIPSEVVGQENKKHKLITPLRMAVWQYADQVCASVKRVNSISNGKISLDRMMHYKPIPEGVDCCAGERLCYQIESSVVSSYASLIKDMVAQVLGSSYCPAHDTLSELSWPLWNVKKIKYQPHSQGLVNELKRAYCMESVLLDAGVDSNTRDANWKTPLLCLYECEGLLSNYIKEHSGDEKAEITQSFDSLEDLFLQWGAHPYLKDDRGLYPALFVSGEKQIKLRSYIV